MNVLIRLKEERKRRKGRAEQVKEIYEVRSSPTYKSYLATICICLLVNKTDLQCLGLANLLL